MTDNSTVQTLDDLLQSFLWRILEYAEECYRLDTQLDECRAEYTALQDAFNEVQDEITNDIE
jgi:hypothetical protein